MMLRVAFGLLLACAATGCTYSVHPLLEEKDLADEFDLTGHWKMDVAGRNAQQPPLPLEFDKYDKATFDVLPPESPEYKNMPEAWTLQIGKVKDQLYAQIIPRELPQSGPPLYYGIPVYTFARLEIEADRLKFYPLLDNSAAAIAEREQLQHVMLHPSEMIDVTVFTMPTAKLQDMVIKHGKKLFRPEPLIFIRVPKVAERESERADENASGGS